MSKMSKKNILAEPSQVKKQKEKKESSKVPQSSATEVVNQESEQDYDEQDSDEQEFDEEEEGSEAEGDDSLLKRANDHSDSEFQPESKKVKGEVKGEDQKKLEWFDAFSSLLVRDQKMFSQNLILFPRSTRLQVGTRRRFPPSPHWALTQQRTRYLPVIRLAMEILHLVPLRKPA